MPESDFYDHPHFDDRNFFGVRRARAAIDDDLGAVDRETPREVVRDADTPAVRAATEAEQLRVSEEQLAIGRRMVESGEIERI